MSMRRIMRTSGASGGKALVRGKSLAIGKDFELRI